ncbi:MAG: hypothetical protein LBT00_12300, partial [Spirochaetaceae bacterium]|nr:hypothetical protein [Spirochaetaceae bacterium]
CPVDLNFRFAIACIACIVYMQGNGNVFIGAAHHAEFFIREKVLVVNNKGIVQGVNLSLNY